MPTTANPAHYERSLGIVSSKSDEFFKRLDLDEVVEYTGDTESPVGFVQLVNVTSGMVHEYVASGGDPVLVLGKEGEFLVPGWYITREDENGLIWAMFYGEDMTLPEEKARADYAEADAVHQHWVDQSDYYYGG